MPNLAVDVDSWARSACYPRSTFYPLSDGHSTLGRRITRTYFRTCSTCKSRSQARLHSCALGMIANHPERTFARLRYILGGDRPSQTTRLTRSCGSLRRQLELQHSQGGIPRSTPRLLTPPLLSLPPILYRLCQNPMSGCSKAPWGLSVQSQVTCIFTGISISPGPSLRQCPNRYTFRAGRNLPDKEFRYLRTVIVTAAVYWGFSSHLRLATKRSP